MPAYDQMISHLEATGTMWLPSDVFDLQKRISEGDPLIGWRGDPTMSLFINDQVDPPRFEVWGIDRSGREYLAASQETLDLRIIERLRDGDPLRVDVIAKVIAANEKRQADQAKAEAEQAAAMRDKLEWAVRQDLGHLNGGRKKIHGYRDAPVSA